jgi:hypothetical protein
MPRADKRKTTVRSSGLSSIGTMDSSNAWIADVAAVAVLAT